MDHIAEKSRVAAIGRFGTRAELKELLVSTVPDPFVEYFEPPPSFYAQGWPDNPGSWPELKGMQLLPFGNITRGSSHTTYHRTRHSSFNSILNRLANTPQSQELIPQFST